MQIFTCHLLPRPDTLTLPFIPKSASQQAKPGFEPFRIFLQSLEMDKRQKTQAISIPYTNINLGSGGLGSYSVGCRLFSVLSAATKAGFELFWLPRFLVCWMILMCNQSTKQIWSTHSSLTAGFQPETYSIVWLSFVLPML